MSAQTLVIDIAIKAAEIETFGEKRGVSAGTGVDPSAEPGEYLKEKHPCGFGLIKHKYRSRTQLVRRHRERSEDDSYAYQQPTDPRTHGIRTEVRR
jgi:hypothetical protein